MCKSKLLDRIMKAALDRTDPDHDLLQIHFTFIINGNEFLSWGKNRNGVGNYKKLGYKDFQGEHSEVNALRKVRPDKRHLLENATLVNIRIAKSGIRISRPCPVCTALIKRSGISKVYYTNNDGSFSKMRI